MISGLPWLEAPWERAARALRAARVPSGLLIVGRSGLGRERLAEALAQSLLCPARSADGHACGRCADCRRFLAGTHADFLRVCAEEPGKALRVDRVRELGRALALTAGRQATRCALITPADDLTEAAANALLKVLEEPPPGVTLILIARGTGRLPATIVSRCLRLVVAAPARSDALAWLAAQHGDRPDWPMLLALAGGAPLAAARLGEETGGETARAASGLVAAIAGRQDPVAVAASCGDWAPARLAMLVGWIVRGSLRGTLAATSGDGGWPAELLRLAPKADVRALARAWRAAVTLAAGDAALNAALARERLVLLLVDAFAAHPAALAAGSGGKR